MSALPAVPFCSVPLCGLSNTISHEFLSQLNRIDLIAQKIFDQGNHSAKELRALVSFKLKKSSMEEFIWEGFHGPSEEKIKLMYAAATVMAIWISPLPRLTYETYRQIIFTNIFNAQKYDACYLNAFCYLKNLRKAPFWKANPDILKAIQYLHTGRVSLA